MANNIISHIVQEDLLAWHREYIDKKYSISEVEIEEINEFVLDPGGMILQNGETISVKFEDDSAAIIHLEHLLPLLDFYFSNKEALYTSDKENSMIVAKIINDNIVKVYMPHRCLVLSLDNYNKIYEFLSDNYAKGFNYYLDLMKNLSGIIEFSPPPIFLSGKEVPEA